MSEFQDLVFHLEGGERISAEFAELLKFCKVNAPEALPHFVVMEQALDIFFSEGKRLSPLIWTLHREASNDGYHGQVQDALHQLKAPEDPVQSYLLSVGDE